MFSRLRCTPIPGGGQGTQPRPAVSGRCWLRLLLRRGAALAGDGAPRAPLRPSVRARTLPVHGQVATVANAPVAVDLDQPLNVLSHLAPQVALDDVLAVDHLTDAVDLVVGEVAHAGVGVDAGLLQDLGGAGRPDAVDIAQRDLNPLVPGNIDTGDPSHRASLRFLGFCAGLALTLLMLWILANDAQHSVPADNLTFLATRFDRCLDFHWLSPSGSGT